MAGSQQVQGYLHKHQIGPLFEDMMSRVISSQPDDPIAFLQHYLDRRASKQGSRKSGTEGEGPAVAKKTSTHDKPWLTNSKRLKPKRSDTEPGIKSQPEWDSTKKMTATSFDDIWAEGKTKKKTGGRSPSPSRKAAMPAWNENEDEDLLYQSYGYSGPHRHRTSGDPLVGEFSLAKSDNKSRPSASSTSSNRKGGAKGDSERNKKKLEEWLKQEQERRDSGVGEDENAGSDDALEMMENLDDLRREGVSNLKQKKGFRIGRSRQGGQEPAVKVSVCVRCAKVMTGGMESKPVTSEKFGELPDNDAYTSSYPNYHTSQGNRYNAMDSDEEFESVSQVTGPRHPVWQEDTKADTLTPRKGAHMFSSHGTPSKGRPMYSPDHASRPYHGSPTRSQDYYAGDSGSPSHKAVTQSWSPAPGYDDSSEAPKATKPQKDKSPVKDDVDSAVSGGGWRVPDYDTDASTTYRNQAY